MKDASLKNSLTIIKSKTEIIPKSIIKLEYKGIPIVKALEYFDSVHCSLKTMNRTAFSKKFDAVCNRNTDLRTIRNISEIIQTGASEENIFISQYSPNEIAAFEYAPLTSCDVERVFSKYKNNFD